MPFKIRVMTRNVQMLKHLPWKSELNEYLDSKTHCFLLVKVLDHVIFLSTSL